MIQVRYSLFVTLARIHAIELRIIGTQRNVHFVRIKAIVWHFVLRRKPHAKI